MRPNPVTSLADGLARRRLLYPSPIPTAPGVMVIDVAAENRGEGLPLGRYYPIILETDAEREALDVFLATPRSRPQIPDLFDYCPSNLRSDRVLISRYEPPAQGWPWISVTCWPEIFSSAARSHGIAMARGCYTMELFEDAPSLDRHHEALLAGLGSHYPVSVRLLSGDMLAPAGAA